MPYVHACDLRPGPQGPAHAAAPVQKAAAMKKAEAFFLCFSLYMPSGSSVSVSGSRSGGSSRPPLRISSDTGTTFSPNSS